MDDSFLLCFNAHDEAVDFHLPDAAHAPAWQIVIDTYAESEREGGVVVAGSMLSLGPRSVIVAQSETP